MKRPLQFAFAIIAFWAAVLCSSCSSTKHVPDGQFLLDKVSINVSNDSIAEKELYNFLRQTPNNKVLGLAKLQLATYNLSGTDSSKWHNRWLRNIGQAPVIYDEDLTEMSKRQLRTALINRGYMDVVVDVDTTMRVGKKKIDVAFNITTGKPHVVSSVNYNIADSAIYDLIMNDASILNVQPGDLLDRNQLETLRSNITSRLRNNGYYDFNKECITFTADTVRGLKDVRLTLNLNAPKPAANEPISALPPIHNFKIRDVYFVTDYDPRASGSTFYFGKQDTVKYRNIYVLYGDDRYIKPHLLREKCFITPGQPFSAAAVEKTYESLSQLGIIKFINIEMRPAGVANGSEWLDAYVLMSRNKKQGVTFEVEGTNSEGDLGFGVGATYKHRNLFHNSELFTMKLRGAYESLSGKMDGFINNRYTEYAGEAGITFPKFLLPFAPLSYRRKLTANTEFAISFNFQERPEYTRVIAGAAWKYKWNIRRKAYYTRNTFDLVDINYVRLPKSTLNFLDEIAPTNPLLRYSYEDHFIMRMGYSFNRSNRRIATSAINSFAIQPSVTTMRGAVEIAGNLLYGISSLLGQKKEDGAYKILGIQYAQYVKAEADYTHTININARNAIAFHIGGGVAVPYLNSKMVPFEKRFYAGGANSVRGWSVRTLGPGCYDAKNSVTNFINQCGDILLNANIEYRAKLFWVLEAAAFVDAGNIWTIHEYENQPGGVFKFDKFYKQIAAAYGIGLRLDFTYFLLRLDLGFKAHNPAMNQEEWPLIHPKWGRDANLHFSIGYPF